jgi:uncharacterized membrane protein
MDDIKGYFTTKIQRIQDNPELIAPYFIGGIGVAISAIQGIIHELSIVTIFASFFIIAIALILYQILNCNVRIYEILSDTEHQRKLKSLWITGKLTDEVFERKMELLKKYPTHSKFVSGDEQKN